MDSANQIALAVAYEDEHLIQLECRVSVDQWSADCRAYTDETTLRNFASELREFGLKLTGDVKFEAGNESGIGLIGLELFTIDRARHVLCRVRLSTPLADLEHHGAAAWQMNLQMKTEPAAIDRFSSSIKVLAAERRGTAVLAGSI